MLKSGISNASSNPLNVVTLANLGEEPFNFNEKAFRFTATCFGGERYVCLKAPVGSNEKDPQVGIIDLIEDLGIERRPTRKALGAMKHPSENILALRGKSEESSNGHFVQVFQLDTRARLGEHEFGDEIVFWRWAMNRVMVVVTGTAVFHWDLSISDSEPIQVFRREGKLAEGDVQVINYSVDHDMQWLALAGIYLDAKKNIQGCIQLWSVEKQQCQFLDGHAACFGTFQSDDLTQDPLNIFSFVERKNNANKLYVMDIYSPRQDGPFKASAEFTYPADHQNDIPIAEYVSARNGVILVATKSGFVMVFDIKTAKLLCSERVSVESVFLCHGDTLSGGIYIINRKGQLIHITVNDSAFIRYVQQNVNDGLNLGLSLAKRYGYPQGEEFCLQLFRQVFQAGRYSVAAKLCAMSKGSQLRTPSTLQMFRTARASNPAGEPSPGLQYFSALVDGPTKLQTFEAIELIKPVVVQGKKDLLQGWLVKNKLECSETLGDMVKQMDEEMALTIYKRGNCHQKVIQTYIEKGDFQKILQYIKAKQCAADYTALLRTMLSSNPSAAADFAKALLSNVPPLMNAAAAMDVFLQNNRLNEVTGMMMEILSANMPDQGDLQTRLLEANILSNPSAAETLLQQECFSRYDRIKIAQLCERAGMFRRALEHYSDPTDIKRVILKAGNQMNIEWLESFCQNLAPNACLEILTDMLRSNRANLNSVVQMCTKFYKRLGINECIKLFETVNSQEGLFYFLGSILVFSTEPEVHYKYIETAAKMSNWTECERVVRESKSYDASRVMELFKSIDLPDPRPMIFVCDIHGFVEDLTEYLYKEEKMEYIDVYVTRVNTQAASRVASSLLDLGCPETKVLDLLMSVRAGCPLDPLIPEMEKRGRLALILPWMEARIEEGLSDPLLNNAVAKVRIELNKEPEKFLADNPNYDPREIGRFCEDKDPHMAVAAYMKGKCDQEMISAGNRHGLHRVLATYLMHRQDLDVWAQAFEVDETNKKALIEQVLSVGLSEAAFGDEVRTVVAAFSNAGLTDDLADLLERVLLQKCCPPQVSAELDACAELQNLFLLTIMSTGDSFKVKELINKLDNYDIEQAAQIAQSDEVKMYEEALAIYLKHDMKAKALNVMLTKLRDYQQAEEFAEKVRDLQVWTDVATCLLNEAETESTRNADECANLLKRAMQIFQKAGKCNQTPRVVDIGKKIQQLPALCDFLQNMRSSGGSASLAADSDLAYCLGKTRQLTQLETLLGSSHNVNCLKIADTLFEEGIQAESQADSDGAVADFQAAKILYAKSSNHAKLTACNIKLGDHGSAVEAAKKAGSAKAWADLALAALTRGEYEVAHTAGLNIVNSSDFLEKLISAYENIGYTEGLIKLLEAGAATNKAGIGLHTELAICYAKYVPERLLTLLDSPAFVNGATRVNVPKIIKVCEQEKLWNAIVKLHLSYGEKDQAVQVILAHPSDTWDHDKFYPILQSLANTDLHYRAISFYLDQHPDLLNRLLLALRSSLDPSRTIATLKSHERYLKRESTSSSPIGLVREFLETEQTRVNTSTSCFNDVLHELYLDLKDCSALKKSVNMVDNFDKAALAARLEKHEMPEMQVIALILYRQNGKYDHAIALAKSFGQFDDAILIAKESCKSQVATDLLTYFASELKNASHFASCLTTCQDLIPPDAALSLAWTHNYTQEVMPYMIRTVKNFSERLSALEKRVEEESTKQEKKMKASGHSMSKYCTQNFTQCLVPGLSGLGGMAMLAPVGPSVSGSDSSGLGLMAGSRMIV